MHNSALQYLPPLNPPSSWIVEEKGPLDNTAIDRFGNKFLIGNGYFGYRGTLSEYNKDQKPASIVSGIYDQVGNAWREPVNFPNGGFMELSVDGKPLKAFTTFAQQHTQQIDMRQATHERETVYLLEDGNRITVRSQRFASLAQKELLCSAFQVTSTKDCTVQMIAGIDADVWDINGPHLTQVKCIEQDQCLLVNAVTYQHQVALCVAEQCSLCELPGDVGVEEERILRKTSIHLQADNPFYITKFSALVYGQDCDDPMNNATSICRHAYQTGYQSLLDEHRRLWQLRWQTCDVSIKGDEQAELALRFSLYHLLSITPIHSESVSIPARGLSGQMYKGAIFWDTEIFMMPFLTYAFPALARNLLKYRHHTLDGARKKAAEYGYRGAFYAWESQDKGDDACTLFNVTDVFTNRPMRTYFRDKQIHISADIAYAYWQYVQITGDTSIWMDGGAAVVLACAQFYLSSSYYNPEKDRHEFLDVTGPDEYHERVHNNTFTNWMAWKTMQLCLQIAEWAEKENPDLYQEVFKNTSIQHDLQYMHKMLEKVYRPGLYGEEIIPQFDDYFSLENIPLQDLLNRKLNPHEYLGGGNGLATTTQILKQADVVLTQVLFPDEFSLESKQKNWEYYEPRTEHGSSLSACSYSIIAAHTGKVDWAYKYFLKTAQIDLKGEGKQYVGTLYIGGTHPAGNGGAWMSAVFGLCGIHISNDVLSIQPHMPAHWELIEIPMQFKNQALKISITQTTIKIERMERMESPIQLQINGKSMSFTPSDSLIEIRYS